MGCPSPTIDHQTRAVRQVLTNNCWYVYHQPAPVDGTPQPAPARIFQARTQRGKFQVCYLTGGKWHDVAPTDRLFQQ